MADGRIFDLFFLFELYLLQNLLLPLQYCFHARKIHLGSVPFGIDMLIEFIIDKIFSEASLVIVQTGVNKGSVDVDEFIGDLVLIENEASAFPFFLEIVTGDIELV